MKKLNKFISIWPIQLKEQRSLYLVNIFLDETLMNITPTTVNLWFNGQNNFLTLKKIQLKIVDLIH